MDSKLLWTLLCHSPGLPKVPGMAGMPRAHQGVLCLSPVGERVSWPGWEGVGECTELCGLCPVNILDSKEGCKERGVRSKGMENLP